MIADISSKTKVHETITSLKSWNEKKSVNLEFYIWKSFKNKEKIKNLHINENWICC